MWLTAAWLEDEGEEGHGRGRSRLAEAAASQRPTGMAE